MINLKAELDNEDFKRKLKELQKEARATMASVVSDGERIDKAFRISPKIDKHGIAEINKALDAMSLSMPNSVGMAFKKTEKEIKLFAKRIASESVYANLLPSQEQIEGVGRALTELPSKADDTAGSFNNLHFATQQIVREMPAATMGLNMFFLAISNNLPYFADAVKQAREENARLAEQGKPTVSVLKQIGGSIKSWQTLLIVGVTLLSMYGKEIGNWVSSLFKGKKAVDAAKDAQKGLNDAIKKGGIDIGDEIVKYKELSEAYKKLGDDMAAKKKFINDNKEAFHALGVEIGNVNEANRLLIDQTPAFIEALKLRAQASAAKGLAEKQYAIAAEKELDAQRVRNRGVNAWEKTVAWAMGSDGGLLGLTGWNAKDVKNKRANNFQKEAEEARNLGDAYFELGEAKEGLAKKFLKVIGVTPSDPYSNYDAKALEDATRKLARDAAQARTDANIAAMREGLKREIAAINSNYDAKERAIADREKDMALMNKDGKLTAEQSAYFGTLYAANEQERKREILEAQKREADKIATMANITRTLQLDAAQSEVDAMKEGEDKVLAEIDLKYRKRREQLENRQRELMKSQKGVLTGEQAQMFGQMYENIDQEEANEIEEHNKKKLASFDDYLIEYGTIQEKILATTRKYEREIADAQSEGERKALAAERDAALAVYEAQVSDFAKGLADLSITEINKMIEDLIAQVEAKQAAFDALDTSDSQEAQDYQKIINELKAKIQLLQKESDGAQRSLKEKNWAEAAQVVQGIASAASDAADSLEGVDDSLASTLRTISQFASGAANLVGAIKVVVDAAGNAINTALGVIGLIATAIQFIGTIISSVVAANKEYKETIENFKALNKELEQMHRLANINSLEGTIFGEDAYGNFVNNLNVMRNATQDFAKSQEAIINRGKEIVNVSTGIKKYGTIIENFSWGNIDESLKNMQVLVKKRGKFANLGDMLPELFGDEGVTLEGLQNLQQSDVWDKLSKENRELIEQMIGDWEVYNQSVEAVNNYLKDIFGDFGATMTDILVDSFTQGTDAAIAFGDAMSDIVERLTKDFIYSAFIKDFVDEAQAKVDALNDEELSSEERVRRLVDILKQLSNDVLGAQDEVNNALAMLDAEGYGIDGVAGQSSSAGGFQAMSQETGSELNGRFTDIQGKVTGINEAVQYIKSLSFSQLQQTTSISETVAQIHNDTSLIEKHTRVLSAIYDKLDKIESNTREL